MVAKWNDQDGDTKGVDKIIFLRCRAGDDSKMMK
jgi:hypothetical protein